MASSYSVQILGKKPFGEIDGNQYCIWCYQITADPPLLMVGEVGLGFPANLDIKDPAAYPEVAEIKGTTLDKSGSTDRQRVSLQIPAGGLGPDGSSVCFIAPGAENSQTGVSFETRSPGDNWTALPFTSGAADGPAADVQQMRGPSGDVQPGASLKQGILPYAAEPFGVYQPLIGWRSALHRERLANAASARFLAAAGLLGDVVAFTAEKPLQTLGVAQAVDRTGTLVGRQLAAHASNQGIGGTTDWRSLLSGSQGSVLSAITEKVISGLQGQASVRPGAQSAVRSAQSAGPAGNAVPDITSEAAVATLLHHVGQTAPALVNELFQPAMSRWNRVLSAALWFAEPHPAKAAYLSPIGILHLFREYFFELGTFLGPPVGHVWLSPGGTVELMEVNTRRTLVEQTVEQSTETIQKTELSQTDQDELSDAVKVENANDTKLGVTASASGGVAPIFQASGTGTFNLDVSRKQAQEQTHKRMREQSSKLSSEVRQNYKTTFRTVTETTDTSSRRYVLQNTTDHLVSYELSRKMRKVAVQVQDLGQQLCWQLYIDNPGDTLGLGEFVHATSSALDPGVKPPDVQPYPANQDKVYSLSIPFNLFQGADSDASDTYVAEGGNPDHGIFSPDAGKADIIQFKFDFQCPPPPPGFVMSRISAIDFHGAQVKFSVDDPDLGANPDPTTNKFSIRLTYANFGGKTSLPFDVTVSYEPTADAKKAVDQANAAAKSMYDDQVALKKEQLFYDTLRTRLKLVGQVRPRPQDDLREEERSVVFRSIIARLYGNESGWTSDDYHVASELIRYLFDVDAMLYFVAPDWWRPREQPLSSKDDQGELQPTIIAEPAVSERVTRIGRFAVTVRPGHRPYYLITEETAPAPQGASLGWLIQLDGDVHRNAFLNSPWVKAVLPIRPGRERDAIAWLRRPEVASADGLSEPYPFDPAQDPPEYAGLTIEQVLLNIADRIAKEFQDSLTPVPVDPTGVNKQMALPTETVFSHGFDPLEGGIDFGAKPFVVFSQWIEVLPTDQVVANEYSLAGL